MSNLLNVEGKEFTTAPIAAEQLGYTKDYLLLLIKQGKIEGKKVGNRWYVHVPSVRLFFTQAEAKRIERKKQVSKERKEEVKRYAHVRTGKSHHTALIETLAIVVIGLSLGVSGFVGTTSQSAVLHEGGFGFLERFAISFHEFVRGKERVKVSEEKNNSTDEDTGDTASFVVAPETAFSADDADALRDSFSDPVEVTVDPLHPDTGIVVPEFKSGEGEAYRFLMVPVDVSKDSTE